MKVTWKNCLMVGVSAFLLYLAIYYWAGIASLGGVIIGAASTLLYGACIAYVVNILMSAYERRIFPRCTKAFWIKSRRGVCMLLAILTVVLALALLIRLIVPQLLDCFTVLVKALPGAIRTIYTWLDSNIGISGWLEEGALSLPQTDQEWLATVQEYADVLLHGVGGVMNAAITAASSAMGLLITFFMSMIFAINILAGKEKLASQFDRLFTKLLGSSIMSKVHHVLTVLNECFRSYIVGQLVEALILGTLCTLGMLILQLPYALMIGALVGVLALIPIAGAYIGAAVGAVMIFSVAPVKALVFLVFLVVLQQIEGNLIYPRTVGSTLHLPGLWVLAAVAIGGGVLGITGMVIFVPITAALYRLTGEWVRSGGAPIPALAGGDGDAAPIPEAAPVPAPAPVPAKPSPARKRSRNRK